jgi:hypothetical protein
MQTENGASKTHAFNKDRSGYISHALLKHIEQVRTCKLIETKEVYPRARLKHIEAASNMHANSTKVGF